MTPRNRTTRSSSTPLLTPKKICLVVIRGQTDKHGVHQKRIFAVVFWERAIKEFCCFPEGEAQTTVGAVLLDFCHVRADRADRIHNTNNLQHSRTAASSGYLVHCLLVLVLERNAHTCQRSYTSASWKQKLM